MWSSSFREPLNNPSPRRSLDIAYRAGVSQATVSRALRGSLLVNQATRLRVETIARELNYKVDKHASRLRTQNAGTLALLLFEDLTADDSLINPFFLAMLASITHACAVAGYDLLISFQQLSEDWQADYEDSHMAVATTVVTAPLLRALHRRAEHVLVPAIEA